MFDVFLNVEKVLMGAALSAFVALTFTAEDISTVLVAVGTLAGIIFTGIQLVLASRLRLVTETAAATRLLVEAAAKDARTASELSQKNLEKTEAVDTKVNGHWSEIEKQLKMSDAINTELREVVKRLTADKATLHQSAAVAAADKVSGDKAVALKEVTDLKHELALGVQPQSASSPASSPAAAVGTIAAVTDAAKTIAEAVPQLDRVEKTGEATHEIVKEIKKKP